MPYNLPKPFFILAPMDDVTDSVFRRVIAATHAPDLFMTEFANVDGLQSVGRRNLFKKVRFVAGEQPPIVQLWGLNPDNFRKTAQQVADGSLARELGLPEGVNFAGVDLNMGCPAKSEVANGACSALILNRPLAHEIITATKEGLNGLLPLSVKTRVGFNEVDFSWIEFLLEHNLDMLTVHGRTRKQMSKVPADWDLIGACVELRDRLAPQTLLVGNGDVLSHEQGMTLAKLHKLDGIMIGRGVFDDPYVFSQSSPWQQVSKDDKFALYRNHVDLYAATWQNNERPIHTLNKFCKIYISGFDGAKEYREKLMAATSLDELRAMLDTTMLEPSL